ncbi:ABC transporter ATP-binding protein [Amphibacillus jilinensis]|uniref:ABC transporter ATP-binding protein n=1 Tax=Amphibacillus jilinensis TaxID=1216008 RepID=UPI00031F4B7D|nr:ABC transporter ATP-binding protein [Amphibacillus jilinensis]
MIEVQSLSVKYQQNTILNNIDLTLKPKETLAIIGPSGCGKSTLLYCLAGLLKPYQGNIHIKGEIINKPRRQTGVILQEYGLFPWKTVFQNAALGLTLRHEDKSKIKKRVNDVLEQLHIKEQCHRYPIQLSGGQQQRVAIARALATNPDLLLMDEPFSSLDTIVREELQGVILDLYKKRSLSVVFVTHNIEEAVFLGKRIMIMTPKSGRIKSILDNPCFGDHHIRSEIAFHEMCVRVREELEAEQHDQSTC